MNLAIDHGRSRSLLWGVFLFCLFPFLLAAVFNVMSTDDYILYKSLHDRGLFRSQGYMFGWTGRYTAIFVESLLLEAGAAQWHFAHTWVLAAGTWAAFYFLLVTINSRLLKDLYPRRVLLLAAAVLLMLSVYVQADIATSLYWFSAAFPYQLAFILFLVLAGFLIRRFLGPPPRRRYDLVIVLLVILVFGCNEIMPTFLILLLLVLLAAGWRYTGSLNRSLVVYLLAGIAAGLFIVIFSGLFSFRYSILRSGGGYGAVLPIIVYRGCSTFYFILKLPLFWVAALALYLAGASQTFPAQFARVVRPGRLLIGGLIVVAGLMFLTLTAITVVTRGPLPSRALNNLIDLTALGLLALCYLAGGVYKPKIQPLALPVLLACSLLAAEPLADAWSSCFSGYFYAAAEKAREQQIRLAAASREKTAVLPPFQQSLEAAVGRVFPRGTYVTVREWTEATPALLYFAQHPQDACRAYAFYFGIDSVIIKKGEERPQ